MLSGHNSVNTSRIFSTSLELSPRKQYGLSMDTQAVLIIILSIALSVFLVAAIVLVVLLIKVVKNVKSVTEKVETVAKNVAAATQYLKPATVSAIAMKFVKNIKKHSKGRSK